jgi:hypothetical protein
VGQGRPSTGSIRTVRWPARRTGAAFTLDEEGTYPFVTHAFGDMVKGSVGVLATENAPHASMKH